MILTLLQMFVLADFTVDAEIGPTIRPPSPFVSLWAQHSRHPLGNWMSSLLIGSLIMACVSFMCGYLGLATICAANTMIKNISIVYIVSVVILAAVQLFAFCEVFESDNRIYRDSTRNRIQTLISSFYEVVTEHVFVVALNILMVTYDCCGVDGVEDFSNTNFTVELEAKRNIYGYHQIPDLYWPTKDEKEIFEVPPACCKAFVFESSDVTQRYSDVIHCAVRMNSTIQNHEGCFEKVFSHYCDKYYWPSVVLGSVLLLIEALLLFSTTVRVAQVSQNFYPLDPDAGEANDKPRRGSRMGHLYGHYNHYRSGKQDASPEEEGDGDDEDEDDDDDEKDDVGDERLFNVP